jgi:ubiquinone/menaquinone biosynthesis C-methylase UbiE
MQTAEELKKIVRDRYTIVVQEATTKKGCCGPSNTIESSCCVQDDYSNMSGYNPDADLNLGCGIPTETAAIQKGETVLDLGSGAGNDVFVARSFVGETGKVIGVDMTPAMVEKAKANAAKLGFMNVDFKLGDIENLPVEPGTVDIVVSNCVLNLVPNKAHAFSEIYRVLKSSGRFSISDIVIEGNLPEEIRAAAEFYVGCIAGAMERDAYLQVARDAGFKSVTVVKEKPIVVPDSVLSQYLNKETLKQFHESKSRIVSITVLGKK